MSDLIEGKQYGLTAADKNNSNKSFIFVKLTDSALRSIEKHVKLKNILTMMPPTIEFQNNNGLLTVPVNSSIQKYSFKLSDVEMDGPHGSFECLRQNSHSSLELLGCMHTKMQICANDDSYENTKVKMAAAEQEHKKSCTKEIKPNTNYFARKFQVPHSSSIISPKPALKPTSLPSTKKVQELPKNKQCFEVLRRPIRKRIIHILAVKPYKRPELVLRLKREGISEKDKEEINNVLDQVAKLKGNLLSLNNDVWNEVQEDWEFYSREELQLIKKKKQKFLKPNDVNEAANVSKPSVKQKNVPSSVLERKQKLFLNDAQDKNIITNQNESCIPNKNNIFTNASTSHCTKDSSHDFNSGNMKDLGKQRSALFSRPQESFEINGDHIASNGTSQIEKAESTAVSDIASLEANVRQKLRNSGIKVKNKEEISMETANNGHDINADVEESNLMTHNSASVSKPNKCSNVPKTQVKEPDNCLDTSNSQYISEKLMHFKQLLLDPSLPQNNYVEKGNKRKNKNAENSVAEESTTKVDLSEIKRKYTTVESPEQRSQYAKDFSDEYDEYLKLHAEVTEISKKFSGLNDRLSVYTEESRGFKKISTEMINEYKKIVNDDYLVRRKRFYFLKAKLGFIKELIGAYDNETIE